MVGSSATAVLASGEVIVAGGLTSIFSETSGSLVVCGILKATADCPARTSHKYRPSSTNFVSFSASLCCSQAMISSILLSTNRARLRSSLGSIGGFLVTKLVKPTKVLSRSSYKTVLSKFLSSQLTVNGTLTKAAGSFRIDDPIDPANKYLEHSFVESPDMMNIYNGIVVLDVNGKAEVKLPDYFEALNRDFRYQLTPLGGYAPLYVSEEIKQNAFHIAGGKSGLKVSWQVTGIRHDPYANAHPIPVEEEKPPSERGRYLVPDSIHHRPN